MPRKLPRHPVVPPDVTKVLDRFDDWRRTKRKRERIPRRLWAAAVKLCPDHGVNRVSKWLGLNHSALRDWVDPPVSRRPRRQKREPTFVEVALPTASSTTECLVELENPRGVKMKIHLKAAGAAELAALGQLFWRTDA